MLGEIQRDSTNESTVLMSKISKLEQQKDFFQEMLQVEKEFNEGYAKLRGEAGEARHKHASEVFSTHQNASGKPRSKVGAFDEMVLETQRHANKWNCFCQRVTDKMKVN